MNHNRDETWMQMALELASCGQGRVEPNPMVGCVIVRDDQLIGRGFHEGYGKRHAEIEALDNCNVDPVGATAYVTLEPCCHFGKTPPCCDSLIKARLNRVVVAMVDPFEKVAGRGIEKLRNSGVIVDVGICSEAAHRLNAPYAKRIQKGMPWVIAKWAMSLDGKIATESGDSKWISSLLSREVVHQIRGRVDAIVVGSRTVLTDDPMLTARPAGARIATRVVVDSQLSIPVTSKLVRSSGEFPVLIGSAKGASGERKKALCRAGCEVELFGGKTHGERLRELLQLLAARGATNVLVEGGSQLLGEFFDQALVDEVHVFIAPRIIGGTGAVSPIGGQGVSKIADALEIDSIEHRALDGDIYLSGRISESGKR